MKASLGQGAFLVSKGAEPVEKLPFWACSNGEIRCALKCQRVSLCLFIRGKVDTETPNDGLISYAIRSILGSSMAKMNSPTDEKLKTSKDYAKYIQIKM